MQFYNVIKPSSFKVFVLALLAVSVMSCSKNDNGLTPSTVDLEKRDLPVTEDDLRILNRADELLTDESTWNRSDDRECEDDEASGKRSLFCALQKASTDVLGKYDHRRAALQEVRFAVEAKVGNDDKYTHRLMEFNNQQTTQLSDIKAVLQTAKEKVESRLAKP